MSRFLYIRGFLPILLILASIVGQAGAQTSVHVVANDATQLQIQARTNVELAELALAKKHATLEADSNAIGSNPLASNYLVLLPPEGEVVLEVNPSDVIATPVAVVDSFPSQYATISETAWWRGLRLVRLTISPLIRLPNGDKRLAQQLNVRLAFPPARNVLPPRIILPEERQMLRHVLNGQLANAWRGDSRARNTAPKSPIEIQDAKPRARIIIRDTGMYRLRRDKLAEIGFPLDVPPELIQLHHRGIEAPMHFVGNADGIFDSDEYLLFYGERLSGRDAWYDDESDVNVYWLSVGEQAGLRFRNRAVSDDRQIPLAQRFWENLHFEEDLTYHHGDDDFAILNTAVVPGEGWVWRKLLTNETFTTTLVLPNVVASAPACSLYARIRGVSRHPVKPNHRVQISLNNVAITEASFSDNEELLLQAQVPANVIVNGSNTLQLVSTGAGAQVDQIYLDWVEIGYWRSYVAAGNALSFSPPPADVGSLVRYQITNLHEPEILLFNPNQQELITSFSTTSLSADQFYINFVDAVESGAAQTEYLVLTRSAAKEPLSVELDVPSNLRDQNISADFIIVTHPKFRSAAQRLAEYRAQKNGFRCVIAEIQDVYDEFHHGLASAEAVREFVSLAYRNWQPPAPRYLMLLGDGSWDPKRNSSTTTKQNYVPAFGNPVSDNRLVCLDGPDDFLPDLFVGRIAVESEEQAQAILDKIVSYETMPLPDWGKEFIFLNGGINAFEQELFRTQSERLIHDFVESNPVAGKAHRIYKTTEGRFQGELLPDILSAIDSGSVMLSFSGHAGSQTWELMMVNEDIGRLQNHDRYPFIASMTCHTARFAEPQQTSFGEDFLRAANQGAVAFWGTSGWGFVYQDGILLEGLHRAITQDSVRSLGVATTLAKMSLWRELGSFQTNINMIDQYTLLGDPALQLALPLAPDLSLRSRGISFSPENPSESDSLVKLQVVVRNRGLATQDSTQLRVVANNSESSPVFESSAMLPTIGYADTVAVDWPGKNRRGQYQIECVVDESAKVREVDEENNRAQREVYFYTSSLTVASPRELEVTSDKRPVLRVYSPDVLTQTDRKFFFELDTSAAFQSSLLQRSSALAEQEVRTSWQPSTLLSNGLYFWRTRSDEDGVSGQWQLSSFFVDDQLSFSGFRQSHGVWQHAEGSFGFHADGVVLPSDESRRLLLQVQSGGFYDLSRCYLIVNGVIVNRSARGHNVLAIHPVTQSFLAPPAVYDTYGSEAAADSMADFLESLPARAILLAGIRDDGSLHMTERAHRALESFGSRLTRSVKLRDSWALIGAKGMAIGEAAEVHRTARTGQAVASDTLLPFVEQSEIFSPTIGPAVVWKNLTWSLGATQHLLPPLVNDGVNITIAIEARHRRSEAWQIVAENLRDPEISLLHIDAKQFPFLRLHATLSDDDGLDSPLLKSWQIEYEPGGDFVVSSRRLELEADSLLPGQSFVINAPVYFFGKNAPDSVKVQLSVEQGSHERRLISSPKVAPAMDESRQLRLTWNGGASGITRLFVEVDPEDEIPETHETNNVATITAFILPDRIPPELSLTVDGREALPEDFVVPEPEIICHVYDDSPGAIRDTSNIEVYLNQRRLYFTGAQNDPRFNANATGRKQGEVILRPTLPAGKHLIEFIVADNSRNQARLAMVLQVADDLELREVMNYPNPFARETDFTFFATRPIETAQVKIFTISGRLIRTIDALTPRSGMNLIHWDGRDADGDELANGVYLYKVIGRSGDRQVEKVGKAVIVR